jgi:hypothetical protein
MFLLIPSTGVSVKIWLVLPWVDKKICMAHALRIHPNSFSVARGTPRGHVKPVNEKFPHTYPLHLAPQPHPIALVKKTPSVPRSPSGTSQEPAACRRKIPHPFCHRRSPHTAVNPLLRPSTPQELHSYRRSSTSPPEPPLESRRGGLDGFWSGGGGSRALALSHGGRA